MRISGWVYAAGAAAVLLGGLMVATAGWSLPPAKSQQIGYRGVAMVQTKDASSIAAQRAFSGRARANPSGTAA